MERLSDRQIFEMHRHPKNFHRGLRLQVQEEWSIRGLQAEMFAYSEFELGLRQTFASPLAWKWRLLVMLLPIFLPVHLIVGARLMDRGFRRMFDDLYLFLAIGFGIWFLGLILIVRLLGN